MNYIEHIGKYFIMLGQVFKKPLKGRIFREALFKEIEELGLTLPDPDLKKNEDGTWRFCIVLNRFLSSYKFCRLGRPNFLFLP